MFRTATLICIGLCLVGVQALAGEGADPEGAVTLASTSGLYVRVDPATTDADLVTGNVCGTAVNTGGVTRATGAVKAGGRVFLVGGGSTSQSKIVLASFTPPPVEPAPARKHPEGLGTLLARIFGQTG